MRTRILASALLIALLYVAAPQPRTGVTLPPEPWNDVCLVFTPSFPFFSLPACTPAPAPPAPAPTPNPNPPACQDCVGQ
jgi:hypothetical protein